MTTVVPIKIAKDVKSYDIRIGHNLLSTSGRWVVETLGSSLSKVVIVTNRLIYELYGDRIFKSLRSSGLTVHVHQIGDGEKYKSFNSLMRLLNFLSESRLSRTDAVLALGGGVVGDLTGFAASVYLRGVPFFQVPTTLLSMIDSSVGGKTGINTAYGKNIIGTFYQPQGVLVDVSVLSSLPERELTAGLCEAIKQGAIANRTLFERTRKMISSLEAEGFGTDFESSGQIAEFESFLAAQIKFKAEVVKADEGESPLKRDARSRKILNFGHTFAHALEKVTNYRYLKHGEAVGHGIIFAGELSKKLALLPQNELNLLYDVVHRVGSLPSIAHIDPSEVLKTFRHDKKIVGNSLQWVLLNGIGKPVIVSQENIPGRTLKSVLSKVLREKER